MVRALVAVVLCGVGLLACGGEAFQAQAAGGSGGSGGSGSCATPTQITLTAACAACLQASCCSELTTCDTDAICPSCQADPGACATGPYPALDACLRSSCSAECSTGAGGAGGSAPGTLSCRVYARYDRLALPKCNECINQECKAQKIASVCGGNPADVCNPQCGDDQACFCGCMVNQPGACGPTVKQAFDCFTSQCSSECN